jgi:uncharacterized Zn-binding protein involved in type VI secretion
MPACTRVDVDKSAGHCYPSRAADEAGQSSVHINSLLATVVGAHYPAHTCGLVTHDGYASTGSSTVSIEGKPIHRIGDDIDCGDVSASGSRNVFAGG